MKNWKKPPGDIIILHKCTKNHDHMPYCSWDKVHTDVIVIFHFGLFFALTAQKIKIKKNEKNAWRYHHFTYGYKTLWSDDVWFLRYDVRWTDRQMDRQMEKVTYRGGCPPKNLSKTTTTKLYPAKKWETNIRQQYIKNKHLCLHLLYCYFIIQSLLNVYKNWKFCKII